MIRIGQAPENCKPVNTTRIKRFQQSPSGFLCKKKNLFNTGIKLQISGMPDNHCTIQAMCKIQVISTVLAVYCQRLPTKILIFFSNTISSSTIRLRPLSLFLPPGNHLPISFVVFLYFFSLQVCNLKFFG